MTSIYTNVDNNYFQEVLDHGDVKIMEEQLANAIESIVVSIIYFYGLFINITYFCSSVWSLYPSE
jgi:hypothetical protein